MPKITAAPVLSSLLILIGGCTTVGVATPLSGHPPTYSLTSGGTPVLTLSPGPGMKATSTDGSLHLTASNYEIEVWLVTDAKTIDDGIAQVPTKITDEFKDFKTEHSNDLTIAGSPAKQLIGTGHEADDGDPGDADVIVFQVNKRIFIACNHGESLTEAGQQGLMSIVQTAGE